MGKDHLDPELRELTNEARRRVRRTGAGTDAVSEERLTPRDALEEAVEGGEEWPAGLGGYLKTAKEMGEDPNLTAIWAADELERLRTKANLSGQEWEAFEASKLLGSSKAAARELGRSPEQVRQEKYRALTKLRKAAGA
ncbi:MAG: hypothetical protein ACR2GU_14305 [Rubrobacteraceae bacterium]